MSSSQTELAQGYALQQQGRLAEAADAFRRVLATEPRNSNALHLLGVTLARLGRLEEAAAHIASAVELQPANPAMRTNLANALSELGRHGEAAEQYARAVALQPDFAVAHRGRGLALVRMGRLQEALASITQAVRLLPNDPRMQYDLGVIHELAGRHEEALACFERATQLEPRFAEALHSRALVEKSLGLHAQALASIDRASALQPRQPGLHSVRGDILLALGRPAEALESYDRALTLGPGAAATHQNRAVALLELGRDADAMQGFDRVLQLGPGTAAVHLARGTICLRLGRPAQALESLDLALALSPDDPKIHFQRAVALGSLERHEESLASFDRSLAIDANSAEALNNRGVVLARLSRPEEALDSFTRALARKPNHLSALTNAGNTLKGLGRFDEALRDFDAALSLAPDDPMTQWSKSLLNLSLGDFARGWPLYESRFRLPHLKRLQRSFPAPRWTGQESLEGRTLLIHAEQGLGDTVQFCRYVRPLEARGAKVVLEVPPVLVGLLHSLGMRGRLIAHGDPLPPFDLYCPLLSLPLAFGTDLDSIPGDVPYLGVDSEAVRAWRTRLEALPGLKVGLNWQGNVEAEKQDWVRGRSFPLESAAPLARVPGVSLVSLQKGPAAEQRSRVAFADRLLELTDPRNLSAAALLETAALVKALDLVVTSDTFTAHLCGALGVPVWTVVHAVPDWRWLLTRADNPWYPTLRLYRQSAPGEWSEVFERVALDLLDLQSASGMRSR